MTNSPDSTPPSPKKAASPKPPLAPSSGPSSGPSPGLLAKEAALIEQLRTEGRVMVAFSGGVDSSYLAWAAHQALGEDSLAVTAVSPSYPASHRVMAEELIEQFGFPHRFIETHEMESAAYRASR